MIKTRLFEIVKRLIQWDKSLEIYANGEDNAYPARMSAFLENSVTASMAHKIMSQYIIGKGLGDFDNIKIGEERLIDIAEDLANDLAEHDGFFVHINYDANYDISDFKHIPFNDCRLGRKDSKEYSGKILVYKGWGESKIDKSKISDVNVYNPDKKVIAYQVEKAGGIENYKGQILFFNMNRKYYYPLARINAVSLDCDNEFQSSTYKNEILRRGFFGKTLVVTRPLVDDSFVNAAHGTDEYYREIEELESERENFKEKIQEFISVGNVGGVLHMEVEFKGDNLEDSILFKNIESNINDKLFEYTEKSSVEKILMAFNNLPIALVKSPDSSLLGNSGESLKEAQRIYQKNTEKLRSALERILNDLFSRLNIEQKGYVKIIPLIEETNVTTTNIN